MFSTELLPQSLPFSTPLKSTSQTHCSSLVSCRLPRLDDDNHPRNHLKNGASAETREAHLPNFDNRETHLMKLLNRSCRAGKHNDSLYFLESVVSKGYKSDVVLCTKLINGFFNSRNLKKVVRVMEILETYGDPDVYSYNAMISGFSKANQIECANQVLDRMSSRGFSPDII